jgi:hypothetical protein
MVATPASARFHAQSSHEGEPLKVGLRHGYATLLTCAALVLLAACGNGSSSLTGAQILQKANAHQPKTGTYTLQGEIDQATVVPVSGTGLFSAEPGQTSLHVTFTAAGVAGQIDVVADDNHVYIRDAANGPWRIDPNGSLEENDPTNYEIVQPVLVGTETINGIKAYHLTGKNNEGSVVAYWFRTDSYYPVQETLAAFGTANLQHVTVSYTQFDAPVTITIPTAG